MLITDARESQNLPQPNMAWQKRGKARADRRVTSATASAPAAPLASAPLFAVASSSRYAGNVGSQRPQDGGQVPRRAAADGACDPGGRVSSRSFNPDGA